MKLAVFARRFLIPAPLVSLACFVKFGCLVHYRTEVEYSRYLKIGRKTFVGAFTKIKADRGPLTIGENVTIADGCHTESSEAGVTIGDDCLLGPHVSIIGLNYVYDRLDLPFRMQPGRSKGIAIGQNVWTEAALAFWTAAGSAIASSSHRIPWCRRKCRTTRSCRAIRRKSFSRGARRPRL